MKKQQIKSLSLEKSVISKLNSEKAKGGGVSGACTSSVNLHECYFACPESVYTPCG
ncbi:hypothetical protein U8527_12140 [Kordia algicida OT-1]|uniref:Uncharacterized protein n=1 Tax=Kordia algicida OT-1 TaxID=391587 RepID=A9E0J2_9FLAO|nr:hypothetical protein [Kordia algicida]EDP95871.1 hypothetical protein KAOT1_05687 [Kordia algicida OT-1]